jgi:hypothetical protein
MIEELTLALSTHNPKLNSRFYRSFLFVVKILHNRPQCFLASDYMLMIKFISLPTR